MKINRPIEYIEVEKRLKENFNIDTDYDIVEEKDYEAHKYINKEVRG